MHIYFLLLVIIILHGVIPKQQLWQILLCLSIYLPIYLSIYLSGSKGVSKSTLLSRHIAVKATIVEEDWRTAYFVSTTYILLLFRLFKYRLFVT